MAWGIPTTPTTGCLVYTVSRTVRQHRHMFGQMFYLRACYRYVPTSHAVSRCAVPAARRTEGK